MRIPLGVSTVDRETGMDKFRESKLTKFAVYCKLCKTEIHSKHRHDFVSCKCGNISIDGGPADYQRYLGDVKFVNVEDRSEWRDLTDEEIVVQASNRASTDRDWGTREHKDHQHSDLWWSAYYSELGDDV